MSSALSVPSARTELVSKCRTKKKWFAKEQDAAAFSGHLQQQYPGQAVQHAYKCEDCDGYHLSTMTPEAYELSKSGGISANRLEEASIFRNLSNSKLKGRSTAEQMAERMAEVKRFRDSGLSARQIQEKVGYANIQSVYNIFRKLDNNGVTRAIPPAKTIESVEAQEKELEDRLAQLRAEKGRMLEAKRLKVQWHSNNGSVAPGTVVLIAKEGQSIRLELADAQQLVGRLEELLTATA